MRANDNAAKEPDNAVTLFKRLMDNLHRPKLLFLVLTLLLIVQSCAAMKSWITSRSSVQTPTKGSVETPTKGPVQTPTKGPVQTPTKGPVQTPTRAKQLMDAGEYQKAIDAYNVEYRKHPQDQALVKEYMKSLEDIKSAADMALDKEGFTSAGRNYNVLLKNYPRFKGFYKGLSFNSNYLNIKLSKCKQSLSKQGFQEYRKGNLSGAIALWQGLLAIDPHNKEIKEALRIAKLQQKNLEENK